MSAEGTEDTTTHAVMVNHEEQYSIWPAERENAPGWRDEGKTADEKSSPGPVHEDNQAARRAHDLALEEIPQAETPPGAAAAGTEP